MIKRAVDYKQNPSDFMDEVMQELEVHNRQITDCAPLLTEFPTKNNP